MTYRLVLRPRPVVKYAALYPMLERCTEDNLAVAIRLNGEPVKRMRGTIRKGMWSRGMRMRSTVHDGALVVWPMETDLEAGLPIAEARGRRWEVIRAKVPSRSRPAASAG